MSFVRHLRYLVQKKSICRCPCHQTKLQIPQLVRKCSTKAADSKQLQDDVSLIRNFSIIAHVDHGKSTLADRLLEITGAIATSAENKQVLDRLPVEKERGITVKSVAASLNYNLDGVDYTLNLIDTPGHVDFANEVSRAVAVCQGVILLIDANEGVQAQTVANFYLAFTSELVIIPVLNKIDLKNANPERVEAQLKTLFDMEPESVLRISAKKGLGVEELIRAVIKRIPPPKGSLDAPFRARLIDSWFDRYRGAVLFISIVDGKITLGSEIKCLESKKIYITKTMGKLVPHEESVKELTAGHVGIITCNMKNAAEAVIGDTICLKDSAVEPLPLLEPPKPMVFSGVFPTDQSQASDLRSAIEKLCLNDPSVQIAMETSPALGYGWRLGFLGFLHLDVFRQRLEQEYGAEVVLTAPSVTYKLKIRGAKNIKKYQGEEIYVSNPTHWPDPSIISEMYEPFVRATIITPDKFLGAVLAMCMERRGVQQQTSYIDNERMLTKYILPLSEVIVDFHDMLKSLSSGYASFDYENIGFQPSSLVKIDILLNGRVVEELSMISHKTQAYDTARRTVQKLKDTIPRQLVTIAIQAVIGGNVLARETVKPFRKDVTAKVYGGDNTRKTKLLKAQSEGKKKMRMFANIQIPKDTFIDVLRKK